MFRRDYEDCYKNLNHIYFIRPTEFRAVDTRFKGRPGQKMKSYFRSHQYRIIFLILGVHEIRTGNVLNGKYPEKADVE